jgi:hypothetical protein
MSKPYAMVRGSRIRLTDLDVRGAYDDLNVRYAVSKSVARIAISEVTESGSNSLVRNDEEEPRLHFVDSDVTVRYDVDIDFIRCDPSILNLVTGVPVVYNASGDIVGFDSTTRLPAKAFALEVWSKIAGSASCSGGQQHGYTLFPFLKGGVLKGFEFANGLVSFKVKGARVSRPSKWGVGPHDLEGPYKRLLEPVTRKTLWRSLVLAGSLPAVGSGVSVFEDVIYGGDVDGSTPDIFDGNTGPWTVGKDA